MASQGLKANLVFLDHLGIRVRRDLQALLVQLATKVFLAILVPTDLLALLAMMALKATQGLLETQAQLVHQGTKDFQDRLAPLAIWESLV